MQAPVKKGREGSPLKTLSNGGKAKKLSTQYGGRTRNLSIFYFHIKVECSAYMELVGYRLVKAKMLTN